MRGQAERLAGFARAGAGGGSALDVGWSLTKGRSVFEERAVVLATETAGFIAGLEAVAAGEPAAGVLRGRAPDGGTGKVVFVFPGQGGQWAGMAAELAGCCPAFAERLAECVAALQPHVDWPVAQTLADPDERALEATEVVQPLLWAVMVALAAAWQAAGVMPDAVAGHSQGEIAAAVVAGILPLDQAARIVAVRSKAVARLSGDGAMAAVAWPAAVAEEAVAGSAGRVWVAALNSPGSVVLAGQREALGLVVAEAEAAGVRTRWLPVDDASHGPAVDAIAAELCRELAGVRPEPGRVPLWSAVTGLTVDWAGLDGDYWVRNLREQVRFESVIRGLAAAGYGVFVEASPHPVLVTAVEKTPGRRAAVIAVAAGTLRRGEGGQARLLASVAEVFVRGVPVDWAAVFAGSGARQVALPTYAFQHEWYWPSPRPAADVQAAGEQDGAEAGVLGGGGPAGHHGAGRDARHRPGAARRAGELAPVLLGARRVAAAAGARSRPCTAGGTRWTWVPVSGLRTARCWHLVAGGFCWSFPPDWPLVRWRQPASRPLLAEGGAQAAIVAVRASDLDRDVLSRRLSESGQIAGVLSLLALAEEEQAGVAGTLVLVQALGDAGIDARLWALTVGAVSAGDRAEPVNVAQAMVWGLGRVVALEYPRRWGGLVDVSPVLTGQAAGSLRAVLAGGTGEDQVAVRDSGVLARRLVRAPAIDPVRTRSWRPSGAVLVTGATGALGPLIAGWLAERGASQLVLVSRRGAAAQLAALAAQAAGTGTGVLVAACDVADRADLARLLDRLAAAGTEIRTVIHAAAVIKLAALDQLSLAELAEVCGAKVAGAMNLDALLGGSVDTFMLFSSIAGIWGSGDHGAYAAANAALDALAENRRARGLAATSVPWGVWLAARPGVTAAEAEGFDPGQLIRQGLPLMVPERAFTGLGQVLDGDEVCTAVAEVDWTRFVPVFTSGRPSPLLSGVAEARQVMEADAAVTAPVPGRGALAGKLAALADAEQEQVLLDVVCEQAAGVLGHASVGADPAGCGVP